MRRLSRSLAGYVTALSLLGALTSAQDVRVLDKTNGPYTNLVDAFAVAEDGDIVLVEPGNYPNAPSIDGKSLTIVATSFATFHHLKIRNLAPDQTVTIRGITFRRNNSTSIGGATNVSILNHEGTVVFEDCRFLSQLIVAGGGSTFPAIEATSPVDTRGKVVFTRCEITGGSGAESLGGSLPPMHASEAIVGTRQLIAVFDSEVTGGAGGFTEPGADAIRLDDSELFVTGGTLRGGPGGEGTALQNCKDGGDGGDAIDGLGAVQLVAASVLGGTGGLAKNANCADGSPGVAHTLTGPFVDTGGVVSGIEITPASLPAGAVATLDAAGPDVLGGAAWLLQAGLVPTLVPTPGTLFSGASTIFGPFDVGGPQLLTGGAASLSFPVQNSWATGQEGVAVHAQGLFFDPTGPALYFGAPTVAAVLLPGFDPL